MIQGTCLSEQFPSRADEVGGEQTFETPGSNELESQDERMREGGLRGRRELAEEYARARGQGSFGEKGAREAREIGRRRRRSRVHKRRERKVGRRLRLLAAILENDVRRLADGRIILQSCAASK